MSKQLNKPLWGTIGLIFVAIMTIVAFFIPTKGATALDITSASDGIKVVVYDQYPGVSIISPTTGEETSKSKMTVNVFYENIDYIDFKATYTDEDGNPVEIMLTRFTPSELDPEFSITSGDASVDIDLSEQGVNYGSYVLTAFAHSPIGYDEDSIEFSYLPGSVAPSTETTDNGDPIIDVDFGEGVEQLAVMVYDKDGNPVLPEPIIINVPASDGEGTQPITLPLGELDLPSGEYTIGITAYKHVQATDEEGNPLFDESGNPIMVLVPIDAPDARFDITYDGLVVATPDTGRMLATLGVTKSDSLITASIIMLTFTIFGLYFLYKKRSSINYRKYYKRSYARAGAIKRSTYPNNSIRKAVARNRSKRMHKR